jgi:hypothetical protein
MPPVIKSGRVPGCAVVAAVVVLGLLLWVWLASRGYLDTGKYVVLQSLTVSPNRVAMLAERPGTGWGGNTFFVVIGDHGYSEDELRKAFFRGETAFKVGVGGLELKSENPGLLIVTCVKCEITKDMIEVQKFADNGVNIQYFGFPQ